MNGSGFRKKTLNLVHFGNSCVFVYYFCHATAAKALDFIARILLMAAAPFSFPSIVLVSCFISQRMPNWMKLLKAVSI